MQKFYDFTALTIDGKHASMADYRDKVVLVVNVASRCTFTPQYEELEKLYRKYNSQGFEVLAFPSNQFREQEPGRESEIKKFCQLHYDVTFPLFSKGEVNGINSSPLYTFLRSNVKGIFGSESIKWNFTKFLIDRDGNVLKRYAPIFNPLRIEKDIEKLLCV